MSPLHIRRHFKKTKCLPDPEPNFHSSYVDPMAIIERLKHVDSRKKVFGIGFSKTGTTSFEQFFESLGYRVCRGHWNNSMTNYLCALHCNGDTENILDTTTYFDAFFDAPWDGTELYKLLSTAYPDALFICSRRNADSWFRSFRNMYLALDPNPVTAVDTMKSIGAFGNYIFFTKLFRSKQFLNQQSEVCRIYEQYYDEVDQFFSAPGMEGRILNISVFDDDNLEEKNCEFLNREVPKGARFPHENKGVLQ